MGAADQLHVGFVQDVWEMWLFAVREMHTPANERRRAAIVGLLDERNVSIIATRVFESMNFPNATNFKFGQDHEWWKKGAQLSSPSELLKVLEYVRRK
jgi:hypothetical protein